jgi:hypothetical protein
VVVVVVCGVADFRQLGNQSRISCEAACYFLHTVDNGGVIAVSQEETDLFEGELGVFRRRYDAVCRPRQWAGAACRPALERDSSMTRRPGGGRWDPGRRDGWPH